MATTTMSVTTTTEEYDSPFDDYSSSDYYIYWNEIKDTESYRISTIIDSYRETWSEIRHILDICCYLSYILVFVYDRFHATKNLNSSFFIIRIMTSVFGVYGRFLDTARYIESSIRWMVPKTVWTKLLEVFVVSPRYAVEMVMAFEIVAISVNRYSATVHPETYKLKWSNRNTVILVLSIVLISLTMTTFELFHEVFITRNVNQWMDLAAAYSFFQWGLSILSLLIMVTTMILNAKRYKTSQGTEHAVSKAEKKLLKMYLILTIILSVYIIHEAIFNFTPFQVYFVFGRLFHSIFEFVLYILMFANYGGSIILLFINSSNVRKAYYRVPPIKQIKNLVESISNKFFKKEDINERSVSLNNQKAVAPARVNQLFAK